MGREEFFRWMEETRANFTRLGVATVNPETFLIEISSRVHAVLAAADEELLTVPEAARRTGYSEDHIGRLIRGRKLPNAGVPNRPRVRAADLASLPRLNRRPFAGTSDIAYDPTADARALRSRRGGRA